MLLSQTFLNDQLEWMIAQIEGITDHIDLQSPSEVAESVRQLPSTATSLPGFYDFRVTPYLREIVDFFDVRDPTRYGAVLKGVQVGYTVGVLENGCLYYIYHIKTRPILLLTAESELAKLRVDAYLMPMLQHSGLSHLIQSNDDASSRKTGRTKDRIEWLGGGWLLPFGARNVKKLISYSVPVILRDEVSKYNVGVNHKDDILKLSGDRANAFGRLKKIMDGGTPEVLGSCLATQQYYLGDKRHYMVPCLKCGHKQPLVWKGVDRETGMEYGISWEVDAEGDFIDGSARYVCRSCGHKHRNSDKTRMFLDKKLGGEAEWVPTCKPRKLNMKSWYLPALYAPAAFFSWDDAVSQWFEAWDVENDKARDVSKLKSFYNSVLAKAFEVKGERLSANKMKAHRREYVRGQVPNKFAEAYSAGRAGLLVCSADVHGSNVTAGVFAVCPGYRLYLVDYKVFKGKKQMCTLNWEDKETWGEFEKFLRTKTYKSDDGREYGIALTLVDASYVGKSSDDSVTNPAAIQFCEALQDGDEPVLCFPLRGRTFTVRGGSMHNVTQRETPTGNPLFYVNVNAYKDEWHMSLSRTDWSPHNLAEADLTQPYRTFNAPNNISDKVLKELAAESKVQEGGKTVWKRHGPNELWDLLIYANAAVDVVMDQVCTYDLELESVSAKAFWEYIYEHDPFAVLTAEK